ncbi:MAG: RNA methyltransferase [Acidobacteria bacterium]|nr:RNA methyltransferase [Acidobacteriota bacterium]
MTQQPIRSRQNPKVKALRAWLKQPSKTPYVFVEGEKIGRELMAVGHQPVEVWTCDDHRYPSVDCYRVERSLFAQISTLKSPQPPLYLFLRPELRVFTPSATTRTVLMDHIQDPGNAGAIVRAATAFGIDDIAWLGGVDPFHPACIRSSVGTVLRVCNSIATPELLTGVPLIIASTNGDMPLPQFEWPPAFILALGNEGHGHSPELEKLAQFRLNIPMSRAVESLNVMGAAHILLFSANQS